MEKYLLSIMKNKFLNVALFLLLIPVFIRLFKRLLNTPDASGGGSSRKAGDS